MRTLNFCVMALLVTTASAWAGEKAHSPRGEKALHKSAEFDRLMRGTREKLQPQRPDSPYSLVQEREERSSKAQLKNRPAVRAYRGLASVPMAGTQTAIPWAGEGGAGANFSLK